MAYSISVSSNELESAVGLDFEYLSNEFRIVRICRFQCIGWILDAVAKVEHEARSGSTWTNPEESVKALMRFPCVPENLARKLIVAESTEEKFNLVWNYISDDEKNTAITINFNHYHNFWPGFQLYARMITLHMAKTLEKEDLKEKIEQLIENSTNSPSVNPESTTSPDIKIEYIYYDNLKNNASRMVVYEIIKSPLPAEFSDDIPY
ncbi:hypothetical protein [Pseudomonas sp. IPO3774]|uniref:hypothetical protein n=1 Tax=Pseudomonas sp. IPO3774 TaxID=2738826 RepID=UPI0015A412BF|nr:hypothetical protein [Pseudomonas sp. IPO3774]NWD64142.1 hypothetical protein [Pseudomonas sp. IPO3774]